MEHFSFLRECNIIRGKYNKSKEEFLVIFPQANKTQAREKFMELNGGSAKIVKEYDQMDHIFRADFCEGGTMGIFEGIRHKNISIVF